MSEPDAETRPAESHPPDGEAAGDPQAPPSRPARRWRGLHKKLLLALASLALTFLVLEIVARIFAPRWAPVRVKDGYYANALPLATGLVAPSFRALPTGEPLPEDKPEGQVRVFVFGESSIQGVPYGIEASPPGQLADLLHEGYPDRDLVVVNMGRVASISANTYYHLLYALRFQPDVVIFYMGANDDEDIGGEQCAAAGWPILHGTWRLFVEHSTLLWTVRAIGPTILWGADDAASEPPTEKNGCSDPAQPRWADILVEVARDAGATVLVTTPVLQAASVLEPHEYRAGDTRLDMGEVPEHYRQLLVCRFTPGCDYGSALQAVLTSAKPTTSIGARYPTVDRRAYEAHLAKLNGLIAGWQAAAEEHGAEFVDFRSELAAQSPGGFLSGALFSDEVHLSVDGYGFLASCWRERLRPLLGDGPPRAPSVPPLRAVRHYIARNGAESTSMFSLYLRRGWILTVLPGIELAASFEGTAGGDWARLVIGWLRRELGMAPGLSGRLAARLDTFDPLRPAE